MALIRIGLAAIDEGRSAGSDASRGDRERVSGPVRSHLQSGVRFRTVPPV